jgi:hypothetical protein
MLEGRLPLFTSCLEEVFSETGLPVYGILGNSEETRAEKRGPGFNSPALLPALVGLEFLGSTS